MVEFLDCLNRTKWQKQGVQLLQSWHHYSWFSNLNPIKTHTTSFFAPQLFGLRLQLQHEFSWVFSLLRAHCGTPWLPQPHEPIKRLISTHLFTSYWLFFRNSLTSMMLNQFPHFIESHADSGEAGCNTFPGYWLKFTFYIKIPACVQNQKAQVTLKQKQAPLSIILWSICFLPQKHSTALEKHLWPELKSQI